MAMGEDQECRRDVAHILPTAVHDCGAQVQERRVHFATMMC